MTTKTTTLQFLGRIDRSDVDVTMEFASLTKAAALDAIRRNSIECQVLILTDIHGTVFAVNFAKVKCSQLQVIEHFKLNNPKGRSKYEECI
jgi:hypothetical protein